MIQFLTIHISIITGAMIWYMYMIPCMITYNWQMKNSCEEWGSDKPCVLSVNVQDWVSWQLIGIGQALSCHLERYKCMWPQCKANMELWKGLDSGEESQKTVISEGWDFYSKRITISIMISRYLVIISTFVLWQKITWFQGHILVYHCSTNS